MFNKFLTTKDVAELLKVSPKTLANHRALGSSVPYVKINGVIRYPVHEVENYLNKNIRGRNNK